MHPFSYARRGGAVAVGRCCSSLFAAYARLVLERFRDRNFSISNPVVVVVRNGRFYALQLRDCVFTFLSSYFVELKKRNSDV